MAAITNVIIKENSGNPGIIFGSDTVAASGDFYNTKFSKVLGAVAVNNSAVATGVTISGSTVTFLTSAGTVNFIIWGV